jgi:hypothetical protein
MGNQSSSNQIKSLPIDTTFKHPANIPTLPQGTHLFPFLLDIITTYLKKLVSDKKLSMEKLGIRR